ncbi:serine/threonine-protein kinase [Streptomyces europaeiscabiei]|uniref:serine/threonine-protein kinase n=1 Tax=Streptomyces europaeiscabiei TaxID=146819 RepID=UPI0029B7AB89|nr:serine/threonine-protein kinase [Streptomyces europaeiscabiei]MDX3782975.1 serine/threonine-protein kinase [Streptomyces europaeiscabiei]
MRTVPGEAPINTSTGDILSPLGPQDPRETAGYHLQARIGEGGMGTVYLSHTRGGQPVALKVIRREYGQDADFRRRFEQEVQAARRVQGYHIVPVVDHDTTGELPWLASAFIAGIPLHDALVAFGPLPLAAVFQLVGCAARALTSIHAAGVIHRDLKPSNILLGSQGPFVIDFGIARAADATHLTQSGGLIGTPQYMSPEHALGEQVTPATDVFSLGLIAAVAATGRHPYGDGGAITIAAQIANTAQRPPRLDGYDERLRPLLERCLTAGPADRVGTEELATLCQESAGRGLGDFTGWLPAPLTAEIARREQSSQVPPQPTAPQMPAAPPTAAPAPPVTPPHDPAAHHQGTTQGVPQPAPTPPQTGFGPAPQGPAPGYGYPPPATDTYSLTPQAPAPTAPPAPKKSRRGLKAALVALALVLVAGSGAAAAVYVINKKDDSNTKANGTKDSGKDDKDGDKAAATPSPSPTDTGAGTGGQDDGGDGATPSTSPTIPENAQYTKVFEGKPFTLRTPTGSDYVNVDFDKPEVDTEDAMVDDLKDMYLNNNYWYFEKTMGKSVGATPQECAEGTGTNVLPSTLDSEDFGEQAEIDKGTRLCTVTTSGNLAMYEVTALTPGDYSWEVPTVQGKLTLWKITE